MKREELKSHAVFQSNYDGSCRTVMFEYFVKSDADSVMDELEMTLACYQTELSEARERIKELEYRLRDKGGKNAELQATNSDLRNSIKELEAEKERLRKEKRTALDDVLVCRRVIMENEDVMEEQKDVISKLETALQNAVDGGNIALDVAKLLESSQPKWISVEDRLPTECEAVVCIDKWEAMSVCWLEYIYEIKRWTDGDRDYPMDYYTHWMPLPPPPKSED